MSIVFRKAFDFELFFHLGPLALKNVHLPNEHYESFCKLSFSVRVLRATDIHSSDLRHADNLIRAFLQIFVDLYREESQSFNFHTMRQLVSGTSEAERITISFSSFLLQIG